MFHCCLELSDCRQNNYHFNLHVRQFAPLSIHILSSGLIQPTSGFAVVGGHDIRTQIDKVHLSIGVCPQFSILWENLTVREHLLFYARLKGISPKEEKSHIQESLKQFGLLHVAEKQSKQLSGGMQRRHLSHLSFIISFRLSVAIALVGDSKIAFLDEPVRNGESRVQFFL